MVGLHQDNILRRADQLEPSPAGSIKLQPCACQVEQPNDFTDDSQHVLPSQLSHEDGETDTDDTLRSPDSAEPDTLQGNQTAYFNQVLQNLENINWSGLSRMQRAAAASASRSASAQESTAVTVGLMLGSTPSTWCSAKLFQLEERFRDLNMIGTISCAGAIMW